MSTFQSNNTIMNVNVKIKGNTMGAREKIKAILAVENITMTALAEKINSSVNNLSNKLRNKTITYELVEQIADILGYDIEFKKRK